MATNNVINDPSELDCFLQNESYEKNTTSRSSSLSVCDHFRDDTIDQSDACADHNQEDKAHRVNTCKTRKVFLSVACLIFIAVIAGKTLSSIQSSQSISDSNLPPIPKDSPIKNANIQQIPNEGSTVSVQSLRHSPKAENIPSSLAQSETSTSLMTSTATSTPTNSPTSTPTVSSSSFPDISFYVMGDVPYNHEEEQILMYQLLDISNLVHTGQDESLFIAHVGDFMKSERTKCKESQFQRVASIFKDNSALPIVTVPGNDDFVNCPHIDQAMGHFRKHLMPLDQHSKGHRNALARSGLVRSEDRKENFAFVISEVLFIGLNMMPDENPDPQDEVFLDDKKWLNDQLDEHLGHVRAVIGFCHSANGKGIVFKNVNDRIHEANIPLVLFQGDEHSYAFRPNFGYSELKDWRKFWRVTVDQGAIAPPVKVTILGQNNASENDVEDESGTQVIIDGFIKIDRRGGTYKSVALADKDRTLLP